MQMYSSNSIPRFAAVQWPEDRTNHAEPPGPLPGRNVGGPRLPGRVPLGWWLLIADEMSRMR